MKKESFLFTIVITFLCGITPSPSLGDEGAFSHAPIDIENLKMDLSYARSIRNQSSDSRWPRAIKYNYEAYDYHTAAFSRKQRTFTVQKEPTRIISHSVGVTEILWAICPRKRIIAFNEFAADPKFCIIADQIRQQGNIFTSKQTELIIGLQPDLVFTVYYSGAEFKAKLKQANIPFFDLGYFGTIESIKRQILLIGEVIGKEGNAQVLVDVIDKKINKLKESLPKNDTPKRILYYEEGGYISGKFSNFSSICNMINAVNVGAEQGITTLAQIDYETLLKWNPDIIIVPQGSRLEQELMSSKLLAHARAIKEKKVYTIPAPYLQINSQYMVLSANILAGIVYQGDGP